VTFTISSETKLAIAEFKLVLPQGISVLFDEDEDDYVYKLVSGMTTKTHAATIKQLADGSYYVLVANSAGKEFKYPSGDYLTLTLVADEEAVSGVATMKNILLGDIGAQQMNTITEGTFHIAVSVNGVVMGDANGDGKVDVSDLEAIARHVMGQTPDNFSIMAADVNHDSKIDVADIISVTHLIGEDPTQSQGGFPRSPAIRK
jgi:hypothetical protein